MSAEKLKNMSFHGNPVNGDEMANLRRILMKVVSYRYFFLAALFTSLTLAWLYNKFSLPVYKTSASLLIEEEKKSSSTGNDQLLDGFSLMSGLKNLDNQTLILNSRTLVDKTLNELPFDTEFYYGGVLKTRSLYPEKPLKIIPSQGIIIPADVVIKFKYKGSDLVRIDASWPGGVDIHKTAAFGDKLAIPGGSITVDKGDLGWFARGGSRKICFVIHSRRNLVDTYVRRIKIEPATKKGSIVKISLEGTNRLADQAFLSKMTENFLNSSLEKKNNEAIRTIQFIDDQLAGISDSLVITENKLQKFRSRNMVMNLSAQGQVIINQAMNLENEKARLGIEASYYEYLAGYLSKEEAGEAPVSPATMGIIDAGLTKLVADLQEAQAQLSSNSMGDRNPLQGQLTGKVKNIKAALEETLKGVMQANQLSVRENQKQIKAINERASALPGTERELLGIERKYKLNDELYTFLLEKRAVAQMQKASNVPDNEMIDYPETERNPVGPKKALIYLFALIAGTGFPFLWLFISSIFNVRINDIAEINRLAEIPVSGQIPHCIPKKNSVVLDEPDSPVAESFRLLRSRMKFFTKEIKSPVILVTSPMPNEGKTFTAINLAAAYSLMGKKTILIGFDLRQPKIYKEFGLDNEHGISSWLIGKDGLEDVIRKTSYDNLHVMTSGPVPPNPSELTALAKTSELLLYLRKIYDIIIIDSSPVGTVSDTFHLASLADSTILVVRQNVTFKEMLSNTINDLTAIKVKGLSMVANDIVLKGRMYGYGGTYGYNYKSIQDKKNHHSAALEVSGTKVSPAEVLNGNKN